MWPSRANAMVRPSGANDGSVSAGFSVSWLRWPSRTAKSPPSSTPSTVLVWEKTTAPARCAAADAAVGRTSARTAKAARKIVRSEKRKDMGCSFRASVNSMPPCCDQNPYRPTTPAPPTEPPLARPEPRRRPFAAPLCRWAENLPISPVFGPSTGGRRRCDELAAVEAQLDHAGGDLAGTVAARVAGDLEFGRQGVEPALRGALADVERLGDLGARGGTAGEGALAPIRGDERGGGRPLLLAQRHPRLGGGDSRGDRRRAPRGRDFQPVPAHDQRVAVPQPPRPVERLTIERRPIAAVEVGGHQHLPPPLDFQVVPGNRLVIKGQIGVRRSPD